MIADARFDYLEGRVEEQSGNWDRLFEHVGRIDQKIDAFGAVMSARIDSFEEKFHARCDAIEKKFDTRCDALDQKLDRKIDDLRSELSKQFRWTIGIMVTLMTGVLAAVLTR